MKKWKIIFILCFLFFLRCTSNKDYINSVKKIKGNQMFDNLQKKLDEVYQIEIN